jgi:hypothetical protein
MFIQKYQKGKTVIINDIHNNYVILKSYYRYNSSDTYSVSCDSQVSCETHDSTMLIMP